MSIAPLAVSMLMTNMVMLATSKVVVWMSLAMMTGHLALSMAKVMKKLTTVEFIVVVVVETKVVIANRVVREVA